MIRAFNKSDYEEIATWYAGRDQPIPTPKALPEIGYIEPGVAAGFLFRTDANWCLIESYIAHPNSDSKVRSEALDLITFALIQTAKEMGFRHIVSMTKNEAIIQRAKKHDFKSMGQYEMLSKEIK